MLLCLSVVLLLLPCLSATLERLFMYLRALLHAVPVVRVPLLDHCWGTGFSPFINSRPAPSYQEGITLFYGYVAVGLDF